MCVCVWLRSYLSDTEVTKENEGCSFSSFMFLFNILLFMCVYYSLFYVGMVSRLDGSCLTFSNVDIVKYLPMTWGVLFSFFFNGNTLLMNVEIHWTAGPSFMEIKVTK